MISAVLEIIRRVSPSVISVAYPFRAPESFKFSIFELTTEVSASTESRIWRIT